MMVKKSNFSTSPIFPLIRSGAARVLGNEGGTLKSQVSKAGGTLHTVLILSNRHGPVSRNAAVKLSEHAWMSAASAWRPILFSHVLLPIDSLTPPVDSYRQY